MEQNINNPKKQSTLHYLFYHPRFIHFFIYSLSYVCFGMMITCLGPMFPYLAVSENRSQIQYSLLFTCRAIGFMIGALSVKLIQNKMILHHLLAFGISLMAINSCLFSIPHSLLLKGTTILIGSIGCAYQDVTINLAALWCFKNDNTAMWLQSLHGFFGVGGLLGPFIVYIFQLKSLIFIGVISLISSILYFYIPSPDQILNKDNQQKQFQLKSLPNISVWITCLSFFFIVGQQCGFGGWVSPFAVLNNFSNKQHATMYSSIYWISITVFRFLLAVIKGSDTKKIQLLALVGIINSIISYILIFQINPQFGLIFMSIFYGLCNSSLYALQLTIPQQFGYTVNMKNAINFVMWASLGDGCLAGGIGKMMGWFSYNWLIYGMFLMVSVIYILNRINTYILTLEINKNYQEELLDHVQLVEIPNNKDKLTM